jgi:phosphoenolpyruvate-protein kinase (PTS system EI component)
MGVLKFRFKLLSCAEHICGINARHVSYQVINKIEKVNSRCIIVKNLNPDYYLLFSSVSMIITEHGSPLAHLAIVARERNMPVLLAEGILSKIPRKGRFSIKGGMIEIEK